MSLDYIISIDAETNGLGGQAFAVAMTLSNSQGEQAHVLYRCPIDGPPTDWVAANVLPAITDVPVNCMDYQQLLDRILGRYLYWTDKLKRAEASFFAAAHVAWPVEARLLLDIFRDDLIWSGGPYPLVDVSSVLLAKGHNPLSVDDYLKAQGIPVPSGSPHNPLYDARAAELCLRHLMGGAQ
jgi:hypothetical protein